MKHPTLRVEYEAARFAGKVMLCGGTHRYVVGHKKPLLQ